MLHRWYFGLIAVTVLIAAMLMSGLATPKAVAAPDDKPAVAKAPLVFNITSGKNGIHAVSMALGLASTAAKQGHEVVVFLNVEAPQFASKGLSEEVKVADFPPVRKLLADVIANGGKVFVCEHCAHVCNVDKKSLADGVTVASHADILGQLKPGMVCFSY